MSTINVDTPVYELVKHNPKIVPLMVRLGFNAIGDQAMLNTVGRFVSLRKGAQMMDFDLKKIKAVLTDDGYEVIDDGRPIKRY
ncbi:MAG: DUF1858 domain-containing protein [Schleiferilactobacillus harbinensis]|jgi:hypothetical protein|nr:DUF1858 domain-containing protein [Schleiferilactobacillus harbinensis]MCI1912912.1 DUF1858 domain-containing protein [Schleiferilactobacillus harbinensis]